MSEHVKRPLPFWLIASLMVNMLLIGALGGFLLRGGQGGEQRGHRGGPVFEAEFSPEDKAAVRGALRNAYEATRPLRDGRRTARRALSEALALEPYDTEAVSAALEDVRLAEQAMQTAMNEALNDELAGLTPMQRKEVARAVMRGPRGRRGGRKDRRGGRRGPGE